MSKKTNWANVDKRIRERYTKDAAAVQASLDSLPDLADACEAIDLEQPALIREEEPTTEGETAPSLN